MLADSKGGRWTFRATLRALRRFEGRSGVALFSQIGKALPDDIEEIGKEVDGKMSINVAAVVRVITTVIDGFDSASALLYECRVWAGDGPPPKLNFDEFCDRFEAAAVGGALMEAVNIMVGCVTGVATGGAVVFRHEEGATPLGDSDGGESTG